MREIEFRGKRVDNGEWVYGFYWTNQLGNHFIRVTKDERDFFVIEDYEVIPETVGQFTEKYIEDDYWNEESGLVITRTKIYEHDRVCFLRDKGKPQYGTVYYEDEFNWFQVCPDDGFYILLGETFIIAKIGNNHDIPKGQE